MQQESNTSHMNTDQRSTSIRVVTEPNCGNAPRHEIARRFAAALAGRDENELNLLLAPEVTWNLVGEAQFDGMPALLERASQSADATQLRVLSVITHGREASIDGQLVMTDGRTLSVCHVLRFANTAKTARITGIRTYQAPGS